jgi:hypothetical protein
MRDLLTTLRRYRTAASTLLLAVGLVACGGGRPSAAGSPAAPAPLLATADGEATGQTVDGIRCETMEEVLFHIHAHLAVFVDGQPRTIPEGIGIPPPRQVEQTPQGPFVDGGACYYWLHSHTRDGVIHIESPVQRTYTLGNYFDIWRQPLGPSQVGPAQGPVIAYLNGQRFSGNPRDIPLTVHALVQLDVGTDVPPRSFTFAPGL